MPTDLVGSVWSSGYTSQQTNVTVDVVGYFAKPKAAALDCQDPITYETTANVVNGTTSPFIYAGTCAAGYASVGGSCFSGTTTMYLMSQGISSSTPNAYFCQFRNLSGADASVSAWNRCCRTPGR
jgi:hypothetical protein